MTKYIILILTIATFAGFSLAQYFRTNPRIITIPGPEKEVVRIDSTLVKVYTHENEKLKSDNEDLNKLINELNAKIRYHVSVIGEYQKEIKNIVTEPDSVPSSRKFAYEDSEFSLHGSFLIKEPYSISFNKILAIVPLEIYLLETKTGWETIIEHSHHFKFTSVGAKIVPRKKSFWELLHLRTGVFFNVDRIGFLGNINYEKYGFLFGIDNHSYFIGLSYEIF